MGEQEKKENTRFTLEIFADGSFKISGSRDFVEQKHKELSGRDREERNLSRVIIGFFYLILFFVSLAFIFSFRDLVFWVQFSGEPHKIVGRISFVLVFSLLGVSLRAFKWAEVGKVSPWKAYFLEYLIIIIISSVFIFSFSMSIPTIASSFIFYTFSAPLAIVAGFTGYKAISLIKA